MSQTPELQPARNEERRARAERLAHDLEAVFPELVERGPDGRAVVHVEGLLMPLIRAVGELDDRLEQIEDTLA